MVTLSFGRATCVIDIIELLFGWPPFGHESIGHEPLIALEQWKVSRHQSLWLVVSNWTVSKRDAPYCFSPLESVPYYF